MFSIFDLIKGDYMRRNIILAAIALSLVATTAMAASIDGRFGMYGKAGMLVPLQDDFISSTTDSKTGFTFGGGLIYGFSKNLAAELDISRVTTLDVETSGIKVGEASMTDVSLGLQYRFAPEKRLVPYLGAGVDFINGDFTNEFGKSYGLDWTVGGHVNAGLDFFINRGIALNADFRGVLAAKGDMKSTNVEYDPTCFISTVGIRFFLPENVFN
jgi:outer membrane protein